MLIIFSKSLSNNNGFCMLCNAARIYSLQAVLFFYQIKNHNISMNRVSIATGIIQSQQSVLKRFALSDLKPFQQPCCVSSLHQRDSSRCVCLRHFPNQAKHLLHVHVLLISRPRQTNVGSSGFTL